MEGDHGFAYKEIERFHNLLTDAGVPHECRPLMDGMQVIYAPGGERVADAVQHRFSYGAECGKVELLGLLTRDELECDPVKGFMTAEEVLQRMLDHWIAFQETVTKAGVVFEGGRSPEAPTAGYGGNGCQLFGNSERLPEPGKSKVLSRLSGMDEVDMSARDLKAMARAYRDGELAHEKRGMWMISCDGYYPFCSNCKEEPKGGAVTPYCPHCGARMNWGGPE